MLHVSLEQSQQRHQLAFEIWNVSCFPWTISAEASVPKDKRLRRITVIFITGVKEWLRLSHKNIQGNRQPHSSVQGNRQPHSSVQDGTYVFGKAQKKWCAPSCLSWVSTTLPKDSPTLPKDRNNKNNLRNFGLLNDTCVFTQQSSKNSSRSIFIFCIKPLFWDRKIYLTKTRQNAPLIKDTVYVRDRYLSSWVYLTSYNTAAW